MNRSLNAELARLRRADPAADATCPVTLDQAVPAAERGAQPVTAVRLPPTGRSRLRSVPRLAVVGVAAAAALVIGTTTAPWSDDGATPPASAYAVTATADGSVQVLIRWRQLSDPASLQSALRAARVPAVVLIEAPAGQCPEPDQDGIPIPPTALVDGPAGAEERQFAIRPESLPAGSTLVLGIPRVGGPTPSVTLYLTSAPPPTCLASSTTVE